MLVCFAERDGAVGVGFVPLEEEAVGACSSEMGDDLHPLLVLLRDRVGPVVHAVARREGGVFDEPPAAGRLGNEAKGWICRLAQGG